MRYGVHGFFLLRERSRDSWIAISGSGWRSMGDFEGSFGDKRRSVALARLEQAMVAQSSVIVRRLGGDRAGEISAHRVLSAAAVTAGGIVDCIARRTASAAAGRRIVVAQDTTEGNFAGRTRKTLGRGRRPGAPAGFFLHGGGGSRPGGGGGVGGGGGGPL